MPEGRITGFMNDEEKYQALKNIFWDYDTGKLFLDKIIKYNYSDIDAYELRLIINRMFERLSWYELLDIMGLDQIKKYLTKENINRLHNKQLRDRYERIRKILFREPISVSGWDTEYAEQIKATLLSNRWYSIK
jgi:hypothetical protein